MEVLRYTIILKEEPEGGYTVIVPSLPGCVTYGKTVEEAKKMAADAIKGYLASLKKHHEPVPEDAASLITSIDLKIRKGLAYA